MAVLCLFLAVAPGAAAMPAPDPPPAAVTPDPTPEAAKPTATTAPASSAPAAQVRGAVSQPAAVPPPSPTRPQQAPVRAATAKPEAKPKPKPTPQTIETRAVVRDSRRVPGGPVAAVAEALDRDLLVPAGLALVVVALGGGVVLVAGSRALAGARA